MSEEGYDKRFFTAPNPHYSDENYKITSSLTRKLQKMLTQKNFDFENLPEIIELEKSFMGGNSQAFENTLKSMPVSEKQKNYALFLLFRHLFVESLIDNDVEKAQKLLIDKIHPLCSEKIQFKPVITSGNTVEPSFFTRAQEKIHPKTQYFVVKATKPSRHFISESTEITEENTNPSTNRAAEPALQVRTTDLQNVRNSPNRPSLEINTARRELRDPSVHRVGRGQLSDFSPSPTSSEVSYTPSSNTSPDSGPTSESIPESTQNVPRLEMAEHPVPSPFYEYLSTRGQRLIPLRVQPSPSANVSPLLGSEPSASTAIPPSRRLVHSRAISGSRMVYRAPYLHSAGAVADSSAASQASPVSPSSEETEESFSTTTEEQQNLREDANASPQIGEGERDPGNTSSDVEFDSESEDGLWMFEDGFNDASPLFARRDKHDVLEKDIERLCVLLLFAGEKEEIFEKCAFWGLGDFKNDQSKNREEFWKSFKTFLCEKSDEFKPFIEEIERKRRKRSQVIAQEVWKSEASQDHVCDVKFSHSGDLFASSYKTGMRIWKLERKVVDSSNSEDGSKRDNDEQISTSKETDGSTPLNSKIMYHMPRLLLHEGNKEMNRIVRLFWSPDDNFLACCAVSGFAVWKHTGDLFEMVLLDALKMESSVSWFQDSKIFALGCVSGLYLYRENVCQKILDTKKVRQVHVSRRVVCGQPESIIFCDYRGRFYIGYFPFSFFYLFIDFYQHTNFFNVLPDETQLIVHVNNEIQLWDISGITHDFVRRLHRFRKDPNQFRLFYGECEVELELSDDYYETNRTSMIKKTKHCSENRFPAFFPRPFSNQVRPLVLERDLEVERKSMAEVVKTQNEIDNKGWETRKDTNAIALVRRFLGSRFDKFVLQSDSGGLSGSVVACGCEDGTIFFWRESETPELVVNAATSVVSTVHFSPTDPSLLLTCSDDGIIKLWVVEENDDCNC